ncbi:serine hydrolase domain-containing protein [uncultured Roseibium sp.]|uniref:serine hydrolase domain-containing protein n=1 Tax=uncultured Roseibium sp. TaxID=1936171 RepID=UPI002603734B|nr:serine hydrolase domain-containing protein [uncultured Roseibium sp.]
MCSLSRLACLLSIVSVVFLQPLQAHSTDDLEELLRDIYGPDCSQLGPARVLYVQTPDAKAWLTCGEERPTGPPATPDSRFLTASLGKLVLSVALLQLNEKGLLDVDDKVSKWLPSDIADVLDGKDHLTIAHLLTMTSGLPDYLDEAYYLESLRRVAAGETAKEVLHWAAGTIADEKHLFAPGNAYDYSNTNYLLAQIILEEATGSSMNKVFAQNIFLPIGIKNVQVLGFGLGPEDFVQGNEDFGGGLQSVDDLLLGFGFGDGGLVASAEDIAAFYFALFNERDVLNQESVKRLLQDPIGEGYGMGIEIETEPDLGQVVGHSGGDVGFSADVRHVADRGATVVYLSAEANDDVSVTFDILTELLN